MQWIRRNIFVDPMVVFHYICTLLLCLCDDGKNCPISQTKPFFAIFFSKKPKTCFCVNKKKNFESSSKAFDIPGIPLYLPLR